MAEEKVVWILGAGFSKSLGAPLLSELLTRESLFRIRAAYGDNTYLTDSLSERVVDLYLGGAHGIPHGTHKRRQWEHAEEFLERLDRARIERLEHSTLRYFADDLHGHYFDRGRNAETKGLLASRKDVECVRCCALRLMAADCCAFLTHADVHSERWAPYVEWAQSLGKDDTIITFNYDRVPEVLDTVAGTETSPGFSIPVPSEVTPSDPEGRVRVFKLHGSVNWYMTTKGVQKGDDLAALTSPDATRFAMATPGPTKREMIEGEPSVTDNSGDAVKVKRPLRRLWNAARDAIRAAERLIFIGYRIPPTDAYTRSWLYRNLTENETLKRNGPLYIDTVLGDDTNHKDSRRLRGILESVRNTHVIVEPRPMWAEDFLGTVGKKL